MNIDPRVQLEARAALRALDLLDARDSLHTFCGLIEIPGAPVDADEDADALTYQPVETPQAAHHKLLIDVCEAMDRGEVLRAMFFLPPGSAKSTYGSVVFPAWFLARKRRRNVIVATYASDLARKIGRRCRSIARQPIYREIFGQGVSTETSAAENWTLEDGNEWMGGGVLSGITGNRADLIVIDDPIKNQRDADSEVVRKGTRDEFDSSIRTRLKPNGRILLIQTRWHEEDLAGGLLPADYAGESGWVKCRDGEFWYVVNVPAMAERADDPLERKPGEFLWPEWFPASHWRQFMGAPRTWSALFQQRPAPASGTYFRRQWFDGGEVAGRRYERRRWLTLPYHPGEDGGRGALALRLYMTSDHAPGGQEDSDYQTLRVWGVAANGDVWLLDGWRGQETTDVLAEEARKLILRWKPLAWFPEDDNNWKAAAPFIRRYLRKPEDDEGRPLKPAHVRIEPISPHGADKAVKAQGFQSLAAMGKVWLPDGSEGEAILSQYLAFPAGKHDDEVDAAGIIGRALDMAHPAIVPHVQEPEKRLRYQKQKPKPSGWAK